jgi:hypothetical protein
MMCVRVACTVVRGRGARRGGRVWGWRVASGELRVASGDEWADEAGTEDPGLSRGVMEAWSARICWTCCLLLAAHSKSPSVGVEVLLKMRPRSTS